MNQGDRKFGKYHDAMYTEEEYPTKVNWGHSTLDQTMTLAAEAGVKKLLFYHHAPERSDVELRELVGKAQETAAQRGYQVEIDAAREGFYFDI
jgi:ribonuclease BN (tRNA processing enzyme)